MKNIIFCNIIKGREVFTNMEESKIIWLDQATLRRQKGVT